MVDLIQPQLDNVPGRLKKFKQWIGWKAEEKTKKDGTKKITKIPIDPKTGHKASTTRRGNWGSFAQAEEAYLMGMCDGIGFVFTADDPFIGVDLDNCFDENGKLRADAKVAISTLNSFTERSPSGNGLHIICEGNLPGSGHCDNKHGREMYQEGRFFTITADIVGGKKEVGKSQEGVLALYDEWFGKAAYDEVQGGDLEWDDKAQITTLKQMPVSDYIKHLVSNGEGLDDFKDHDDNPDRSLALFTICREMVNAGINKESILTTLTDEENYISSAALERRKNQKSAIDWVWKYTLSKIVARYEQEMEMLFDDDDFDDDDLSDVDKELAELGLTDAPKEEKKKAAVVNDIPYVKGDHELNAKLFLKHNPMMCKDSFLYLYEDTSYVPISKDELEAAVHHSMFGRKFPMATIDNTIKLVKRLATRKKYIPCRDMISLLNGVLDVSSWDKGVADFTLKKHSPKYHIIGTLDFDFDPEADAPVFKKFMGQVYEHDDECIELLLNYGGYCLIDDYRHQKILLMIGKSRSGKGTILNNIINRIVGKTCFGATSLTSLAQPHGVAQLINKKVGVISEAKHGRKDLIARSNEMLLSISGNDAIAVNPKNKDEFTTTLGSRLIMACNDLPRYSDGHNALGNRYLILPHNVSFAGNEDPLLAQKLSQEISGIFNMFLAGLVRLGERGHFVQPKAAHTQDEEIKQQQNPVGYFADNFLVKTDDKNDRISKSEMYDNYITVANSLDCPMRSQNWFGRELTNNAGWIKTGKERAKDVEEGHSRKNCYIGVKIDTEKIQSIIEDMI